MNKSSIGIKKQISIRINLLTHNNGNPFTTIVWGRYKFLCILFRLEYVYTYSNFKSISVSYVWDSLSSKSFLQLFSFVFFGLMR